MLLFCDMFIHIKKNSLVYKKVLVYLNRHLSAYLLIVVCVWKGIEEVKAKSWEKKG